ncbi:unnamed protein product [Macrosiphum euphorbiae]|uniref:Uncharacterized protein n=1 Tax=Macrosiphum euphorbiae TaxID=13131 RepID=A0AAV0Y6H9_9HEMI|nr:unnamed protein product [Macrosiphum euphorbiae]
MKNRFPILEIKKIRRSQNAHTANTSNPFEKITNCDRANASDRSFDKNNYDDDDVCDEEVDTGDNDYNHKYCCYVIKGRSVNNFSEGCDEDFDEEFDV